ncbi:MAG: VOC family protein [Hyphomonadaceae bacterium]|nr:VOC family protein [Hyphomonadaceae bacterium]
MTQPISSLIRCAVFVRDLERSTAFYRALGLTDTYYEGTLHAGSVAAALVVAPETVTRCRIVKRPGTPNYGMVGLFELTTPTLEPLPCADAITPRAGEATLVFYVTDMDATMAAAAAAGASVIGPIALFTMPHRSQREGCLRDPDGVLINVIERPIDEQFSDRPVQV